MERIKQAIENAKNPGMIADTQTDVKFKRSTAPASGRFAGINKWDLFKKTVGLGMIFLAGWLWLKLDFLNQLELVASDYINESVQRARAEIRHRKEEEERFRLLAQENYQHCLDNAESDKKNYLQLAQKDLHGKIHGNGTAVKLTLSSSTLEEAERMLSAAKAQCQMKYTEQLAR